ncbi:DUF427-domain-containing protein [Polychaeton citri CBS 116435]|uniref:DUF427-domain-containing protein n=1 Tax=Polychaeton citri CBS 116435 TaxID=1314669 RepID=A0A9P4QFM3_9PEZI|nr:DUF427-domain-containing protein [Polychaeton citri CBS 116435]
MSDLKSLAIKLATQGPHKVLPTERLIQLIFAGTYVARSTKAQYVWEHPFYPQYYVPAITFDTAHISHREPIVDSSSGATVAEQWTLSPASASSSANGGEKPKSTDQVIAFAEGLSGPAVPLRGLVKVAFDAMDTWLEESTPIHIHPKDPFKRIDIIASSRRVKVSLDGILVADTPWGLHLYETGLPRRFYLPLTAVVDVSVLRRTGTTTGCPYKGTARYWSVDLSAKGGGVHEDVVWGYETPTIESAAIAGLLCFYNEKVDIELDGEKLARPDTHFGKTKPGTKPSV